MKSKILESLKTKFVGVKEDVLDRIASKAAKTITNEDDVATYIEGVTFQTIIDAEGDRRATDAQKTAVANYEKKHGLKEGKPQTKAEPTDVDKATPPAEDMPAWAKALVESNKALNDRLTAMDGERTNKSRKAKLDEIIKNAPEKLRGRYEKDFERFSFKDDDDFNNWLTDTKTDVEGITNDFTTKNGIIGAPKAGAVAATKQVSPIVAKRIETQKAAEVTTAIQG